MEIVQGPKEQEETVLEMLVKAAVRQAEDDDGTKRREEDGDVKPALPRQAGSHYKIKSTGLKTGHYKSKQPPEGCHSRGNWRALGVQTSEMAVADWERGIGEVLCGRKGRA